MSGSELAWIHSSSAAKHSIVTGDFEAVYRDLAPRIYRYCAYRTNSLSDAEDITAEVFVRLLRRGAESLAPDRILPWLFKVAGNLCADHFSKDNRSAHLRRELGEGVIAFGERAAAEHPFGLHGMQAIFARLKHKEQQIVFLRIIEDFSFKEIAGATGKRKGSVKMLYYRAIEKLRTAMEAGND